MRKSAYFAAAALFTALAVSPAMSQQAGVRPKRRAARRRRRYDRPRCIIARGFRRGYRVGLHSSGASGDGVFRSRRQRLPASGQ